MALGLYTALPGTSHWDDGCQPLLAPMLPFVGVALGTLWWLVALVAKAALPRLLGVVALTLAMPALTGFLHLDGYMDVADAVLARRDREEKLRILKDPHAGAFAVIALGALALVALGAADAALPYYQPLGALVCVPVVSRALAALALMTQTPLAGSVYGRMNFDSATPGKLRACWECLVCVCALALLLGGVRVLLVCVAAGAGFVAACRGAIRSLGGMNGDIAGFSICCAEVCGLVALALV